MSEPLPLLERMPTGIPGLDRVLGGGLPGSGVYMVEGPPGAGKTILGNQICFHHAERGSQAIYLTLLAESHTRMIAHIAGLSFFRSELVGASVHYVSGFKMLESDALGGLLRTIRETISARRATLLVVDGLVSATESGPTAREFKKFVHELQIVAGMARCTVLLLTSTQRPRAQRPERTMVDGIIELSDEPNSLRAVRQLQVRKLRGTDFVRGKHTLAITRDGVAVRPRIEAELLRLPADADLGPGPRRLEFGIQGLDRALGGGLPERSTTMLIGPSGSGKTILCLDFLAFGGRSGEAGMFFGFYERPKALLAKAERLGMGLSQATEQGLIRMLWEPYGEGDIDTLGDRLLRAVQEHRPSRLVVDGLHGFEQSVSEPGRLGGVIASIAEELEARGVTTLYTMELPHLLSSSVRTPIRGVSAIAHNIILLRFAELGARVCHTLSVLKVRDSGHENKVLELAIGDFGIAVKDALGPTLTASRPAPPAASERRPEQESPAAPRPSPSLPSTPRGNILIVDDEFGLADVLADILNERGYATTIAINGELGLQALRENEPDIVLLDFMMPVISGPEMLRSMKANEAYAGIPVVLMTALPGEVPRETAGECEAVLQKPFSPEQVLELIERILERK